MSRFLLRLLALIYFALFFACVLMSAGLVEMLPIYSIYYDSFPDYVVLGPVLLLLFSVICWRAAGAPRSTEYEEDIPEEEAPDLEGDELAQSPTLVIKRSLLDTLMANMTEAEREKVTAAVREDVRVSSDEAYLITDEAYLITDEAYLITDEAFVLEKAAGAEETFAVAPMPRQESTFTEPPRIRATEKISVSSSQPQPAEPESRPAIGSSIKNSVKKAGRRAVCLLEETIAPLLYKVFITKGLVRIGSFTARIAKVIGKQIHTLSEKISQRLRADYEKPLPKEKPSAEKPLSANAASPLWNTETLTGPAPEISSLPETVSESEVHTAAADVSAVPAPPAPADLSSAVSDAQLAAADLPTVPEISSALDTPVVPDTPVVSDTPAVSDIPATLALSASPFQSDHPSVTSETEQIKTTESLRHHSDAQHTQHQEPQTIPHEAGTEPAEPSMPPTITQGTLEESAEQEILPGNHEDSHEDPSDRDISLEASTEVSPEVSDEVSTERAHETESQPTVTPDKPEIKPTQTKPAWTQPSGLPASSRSQGASSQGSGANKSSKSSKKKNNKRKKSNGKRR